MPLRRGETARDLNVVNVELTVDLNEALAQSQRLESRGRFKILFLQSAGLDRLPLDWRLAESLLFAACPGRLGPLM